MAEVVFDNVTKRFGKVVAVKNLSLVVKDQEFMTLLGPSGCGKTTTLNLLAGLETPDEGEIFVDGAPVGKLSPRDRNVAMVFQNYALYPHMTVFENLAFPLKARGRHLQRAEIDRRVRTIGETLGLAALLDRYPRQLSGGQRQRVALGRALVREPKVFLMDEPLSNLDARLRLKMRAELKQLHQDTLATIVYVTHDQAEAMTLSSRIAIFREGEILQVDAPNDLYRFPRNKFTANFVGEREMNFLPGELVHRQGQLSMDGPGYSIPLPGHLAQAVAGRPAETTWELGVRAEDVVLSTVVQPAAVPSKVTLVEPMGSHDFVHATVGRVSIVATVAADRALAPGERVWVSFTNEVHLFDGKTGERLPAAAGNRQLSAASYQPSAEAAS